MALKTKVAYPASSGQREFDVPFPYLDAGHVKASVRGVAQSFDWVSPSRLRLVVPRSEGEVVLVERVTPTEPLVTFHNGAVLTEEDLNKSILQVLYIQQELAEQYADGLGNAKVRLGENNGVVTDPEKVLDELAQMLLGDELLAEFRQRIADIDLNAQAIIEQSLRVNTVHDEVVDLDNRVGELRGDFEGLVGVVDGIVQIGDGEGLATVIQTERDERIEGDTALAETIALIGAASADNQAFILDLNRTRVSSTESLATRLSAISAEFGDVRGLIVAEQTARASEDEALAQSLSGLQARIGAAEGSILQEQQARAAEDEALAESLTLLTARVGDAEAGITAEQLARTSADDALALDITQVQAEVADAKAQVTQEAAARASADEALASDITVVQSGVDEAKAQVAQEAQTRATAIAAEASARQALAAVVDQQGAAIQTEQQARIDGDAAEAQARQQLAARVTSAESAIQQEQTARANGDAALTQTLALLGARNAGSTAFILDLNTVQVGGGVSMGTRLSGIDTRIGNNEAAVINEQTARVDGDNALSQSITSLTQTVNGNHAEVTQLAEIVDGVRARAGLAINVNGHITGWRLNNDGAYGSFVVAAESFGIVSGSAQPVTPFTYDAVNGILNINSARLTGSISINDRFIVAPDGSLTIRSALTGERMVITDRLLTVYDVNNVARVELGLFT